ncbi:MAG TPA: hypothetical protein VI548_11530 [Chitinophagaceae bacterium]|nr:hypothetical protein [Chitinophagaceae bacterium]
MNIAVIASCLYDESLITEKTFVKDLLSILSSQHHQLKFFIIVGKQTAINLNNNTNYELIKCGSPGKTILQKRYWWEIRLPRFLKKIKTDILLSFDGQCASSLTLPQVLIEFGCLRTSASSIKKARRITVNSEWEKGKLIKKHHIAKTKIEILSLAVKGIEKPDENKREKIKTNYSGGKEYFLCPEKSISGEVFISLLKSFSQFKKRQQSSLKLLLFSKPGKKYLEIFSSYKYRNDVLVADELSEPEQAVLISAAYAVLVFQNDSQSVLITLQSFQSGAPVLAPENSPVKEYAGDAALYFEENNGKEIAGKMIHIYTNEEVRNQLIRMGKEKALNFTIEKSANQLWTCIQKAIM